MKTQSRWRNTARGTLRCTLAAACAMLLPSCDEKPAPPPPAPAPPAPVLRISAPPVLANIAKSWGEAFKARSGVQVEVAPGGQADSVVRDLVNEGAVTALGFQSLRPDQKAQVLQKHGNDIIEIVAGVQASAVYVHQDNPLQSLSMEQLKGIFGQDGGLADWKQMGVDGIEGPITPLALKRESPEFAAFFEMASRSGAGGDPVLPAAGITSCDDTAGVIAAVAANPHAIGLGNLTADEPKGVRRLPVAASAEGQATAPGINEVRMGRYPLSRRFHVYAVGPMEGAVKDFVAFVLSAEGQQLLAKAGGVPLR